MVLPSHCDIVRGIVRKMISKSQLRSTDKVSDFLASGQFRYAAQEIALVDSPERSLTWFEWLVRPGAAGALSTTEFVEAIEALGLGVSLDQRTAMDGLAWLARQPATTRLTINISSDSLGDNEFIEGLSRRIRATPILPTQLCFDLAVHSAIRNLSGATRFVKTLRALGCEVALDSGIPGNPVLGLFGPLGFVNYVKIDRQWIVGAASSSASHATTLKSIVDYARRLRLPLIAEGVDTPELLTMLSDLGVQYFQGHLRSAPVVVAARESGMAELQLVG